VSKTSCGFFVQINFSRDTQDLSIPHRSHDSVIVQPPDSFWCMVTSWKSSKADIVLRALFCEEAISIAWALLGTNPKSRIGNSVRPRARPSSSRVKPSTIHQRSPRKTTSKRTQNSVLCN